MPTHVCKLMAWEFCFLNGSIYTQCFTFKIQGSNMIYSVKKRSKWRFNHLLFTNELNSFVYMAFRTKFCRLLQIVLKMPLKSCKSSVLDPEITRSSEIYQIFFLNFLLYQYHSPELKKPWKIFLSKLFSRPEQVTDGSCQFHSSLYENPVKKTKLKVGLKRNENINQDKMHIHTYRDLPPTYSRQKNHRLTVKIFNKAQKFKHTVKKQ